MEIDTGVQATPVLPTTLGMNPNFPQPVALEPGQAPSIFGPVDVRPFEQQLSYYQADEAVGQSGWLSPEDTGLEGPSGFSDNQVLPNGEIQKRPRACEACRGLKVRCDLPPDADTCKRCAKARRQCIVTVPSRKRQRRTDPKVADLEKRIDDLTATVEEQRRQLMAGRELEGDEDFEMAATEHTRKRRKRSDFSESQSPFSPLNGQHSFSSMLGPVPSAESARIGNEYADVIDRGLLTSDQARSIFDHYRTHMEIHLPCVAFGPNTSAGTVRKTKPIVFLAILSVASGQIHPELHRRLGRAAMRAIADRVICYSEKSLELVQAMQILTIWHSAEDPRDTMTFQLVQLACSMAISLDLNGGQSKNGFVPSLPDSSRPSTANTPDAIEGKRAWLSCFLLSGISSLPMRQQNAIRWSPFLESTVDLLRTGQGTAESDAALCQWVEVQRVSDRASELAHELSSSSTHKNAIKREVNLLISRLLKFRTEADGEASISLKLQILEAEVYARMVAMKTEEDTPARADATAAPSEGRVAAIRACCNSIHTLLDELCQLLGRGTALELNALPSFHFSRAAYCLVALICLHFGTAAGSSSKHARPGLAAADLRVGEFLARLLELLHGNGSSVASDDGSKRPAQRFHLLVKMLRAWFERARGGRRAPSMSEVAQVAALQVRPVSEARGSPRMGYRKLSVVRGDGESVEVDEDELLPPPPPPRSSSNASHLSQRPTPTSRHNSGSSIYQAREGSAGAAAAAKKPQSRSDVKRSPSSISPMAMHNHIVDPPHSQPQSQPQSAGPVRYSQSAGSFVHQQQPALQDLTSVPPPPSLMHATTWPLGPPIPAVVGPANWFPPGYADTVNLSPSFPPQPQQQQQQHQHQHQHQQQPQQQPQPLQQQQLIPQQPQPQEQQAPVMNNAGWAPDLAMDPAVEQAMGMMFGADAQALVPFMDEFFAGLSGGAEMGDGFGGWYGGEEQ